MPIRLIKPFITVFLACCYTFGFWYAIFSYMKLRQDVRLEKLIGIFIIISLGQVALAFVQYGLPPDNVLNRYAAM